MKQRFCCNPFNKQNHAAKHMLLKVNLVMPNDEKIGENKCEAGFKKFLKTVKPTFLWFKAWKSLRCWIITTLLKFGQFRTSLVKIHKLSYRDTRYPLQCWKLGISCPIIILGSRHPHKALEPQEKKKLVVGSCILANNLALCLVKVCGSHRTTSGTYAI